MGSVLCVGNFLMCPGGEASQAGDLGSPSACVQLRVLWGALGSWGAGRCQGRSVQKTGKESELGEETGESV